MGRASRSQDKLRGEPAVNRTKLSTRIVYFVDVSKETRALAAVKRCVCV